LAWNNRWIQELRERQEGHNVDIKTHNPMLCALPVSA
jgi:hypothetical protein